MDYPKVSIIILNWNGWEDTIECLESLYQIDYPNYDVIVVDNASKDKSLYKIREYAQGKIQVESDFFEYEYANKPIKITEIEKSQLFTINAKNLNKLILIKNEENYGFAEGNNIGMKFSMNHLKPDYILLLNNDTVVDKNFLKELVKVGEIDEKIGIIGPKIYYYDKPQTIWCIGCKISWKLARGIHIGNNELDEGQYEYIDEVEYVSGSAFLIKSEVLNKIGFLDKKFFLYFEESDLAIRALKKGYKILYAPKAKTWHKISSSSGGIYNPIGIYYITRNRWLFMKKWANKCDYGFFILSQIIIATIFPFIFIIYNYNKKLFWCYYFGLYDGIKIACLK